MEAAQEKQDEAADKRPFSKPVAGFAGAMATKAWDVFRDHWPTQVAGALAYEHTPTTHDLLVYVKQAAAQVPLLFDFCLRYFPVATDDYTFDLATYWLILLRSDKRCRVAEVQVDDGPGHDWNPTALILSRLCGAPVELRLSVPGRARLYTDFQHAQRLGNVLSHPTWQKDVTFFYYRRHVPHTAPIDYTLGELGEPAPRMGIDIPLRDVPPGAAKQGQKRPRARPRPQVDMQRLAQVVFPAGGPELDETLRFNLGEEAPFEVSQWEDMEAEHVFDIHAAVGNVSDDLVRLLEEMHTTPGHGLAIKRYFGMGLWDRAIPDSPHPLVVPAPRPPQRPSSPSANAAAQADFETPKWVQEAVLTMGRREQQRMEYRSMLLDFGIRSRPRVVNGLHMCRTCEYQVCVYRAQPCAHWGFCAACVRMYMKNACLFDVCPECYAAPIQWKLDADGEPEPALVPPPPLVPAASNIQTSTLEKDLEAAMAAADVQALPQQLPRLRGQWNTWLDEAGVPPVKKKNGSKCSWCDKADFVCQTESCKHPGFCEPCHARYMHLDHDLHRVCPVRDCTSLSITWEWVDAPAVTDKKPTFSEQVGWGAAAQTTTTPRTLPHKPSIFSVERSAWETSQTERDLIKSTLLVDLQHLDVLDQGKTGWCFKCRKAQATMAGDATCMVHLAFCPDCVEWYKQTPLAHVCPISSCLRADVKYWIIGYHPGVSGLPPIESEQGPETALNRLTRLRLEFQQHGFGVRLRNLGTGIECSRCIVRNFNTDVMAISTLLPCEHVGFCGPCLGLYYQLPHPLNHVCVWEHCLKNVERVERWDDEIPPPNISASGRVAPRSSKVDRMHISDDDEKPLLQSDDDDVDEEGVFVDFEDDDETFLQVAKEAVDAEQRPWLEARPRTEQEKDQKEEMDWRDL